MPRHPPCALNNLHHKHNTTIKHIRKIDARIHYTILKHQPDNPTTPTHPPTQPCRRYRPDQAPEPKTHTPPVLPQDPTACRHTTHPANRTQPVPPTPQECSTSADTGHQAVTHPVVPQFHKQPTEHGHTPRNR